MSASSCYTPHTINNLFNHISGCIVTLSCWWKVRESCHCCYRKQEQEGISEICHDQHERSESNSVNANDCHAMSEKLKRNCIVMCIVWYCRYHVALHNSVTWPGREVLAIEIAGIWGARYSYKIMHCANHMVKQRHLFKPCLKKPTGLNWPEPKPRDFQFSKVILGCG